MSFYNNSEVLAKSNKTTLEQHSIDCINILDVFLNSKEDLLRNRCELLNIDYNALIYNMRKSVFFHDFGKANNLWQEKIRANDNEKLSLPPHAIYSGFFLNFTKNKKDIIPLLSVISHHSLLTENSFEGSIKTDIKYNKDYLSNLAQKGDYFINEFESLDSYLKILKNFKIKSQFNDFRAIEKKSNKTIIDIIFKSKYCISLSYLTLVDGLSSKYEIKKNEFDKNQILNNYPSPQQIYNSTDFVQGRKLTHIQKMVLSNNKSNNLNDLIKPLIIEAPCGEGKTLASLIYSKKLFKEDIIDKVIFVLPTQITSNNMFIEFNKEYGILKKWIGIYHSEVLSFLINNEENDINSFNPYFEKYNNLIYSKSFNISTIDHLLLSLVNGYKHAPRTFGNILNSLIIIDELHYYDQHTLNLIEVLCKILRLLKIPHIIMTATMPNYIKNKFDDKNYQKIKSSGHDNDNIEKNPYDFCYHRNQIYEKDKLNKDFLKILKDNKDNNLGIIVNTIKQSKKIYNSIKKICPEKQILLYNSQFMKKDRPIKEKILKIFSNINKDKSTIAEKEFIKRYGFNPDKKIIFIGTQVAEISLNISFDTLISEIAPLDAIIQRGGRLHRSMTYNNSNKCSCKQCQKLGKNHTYNFHIFETGKYCYPYYTKKDEEEDLIHNVIENTQYILSHNKKFTFNNSIDWMNKVYQENKFEDTNNEIIKRMYEDKIREDLIFGKKPTYSEEDGGQLRIQTRNIEVHKIQVLPQKFEYNKKIITATDFIDKIYRRYNYEDKLTKKGLLKIVECMINITYNNNITKYNKGEENFNIITNSYDFQQGLY